MEPVANIEIRVADVSDAANILKCLATAFEPYRAEYTLTAYADTVLSDKTVHLRLQQMHALVATIAGNVVGTIAASANGEAGHLRGMAVLPEWRGSGVAIKLLAAIEHWLHSRGCNQVTLDTTLPLKTAMRFYEKNGYYRSGNISDFFGMPLIEYVKPI